MTWVAVAIGGSALVGAGASYLGSKKQAGAAKDAANLQMQQFGVINQQQQPYIQSGYGALGRLNTLLGLSPNPYGGQMRLPSPVQGGQMNTQGVPSGMYVNGPNGAPVRTPQQIPYLPQQGGSQNTQLRQILALRAAHGDTQAQSILGSLN